MTKAVTIDHGDRGFEDPDIFGKRLVESMTGWQRSQSAMKSRYLGRYELGDCFRS